MIVEMSDQEHVLLHESALAIYEVSKAFAELCRRMGMKDHDLQMVGLKHAKALYSRLTLIGVNADPLP